MPETQRVDPAVLTAGYWRWDPGFPLRVHRRILSGYGRRRSWPGHVVQVGQQLVRRGPAPLTPPSEPRLEAFAAATGVPPARQLERLAALAARGVPARDAWRLGLVRDSWASRWPEFVYDDHDTWNLCASGRRARAHLELLGDKAATADLLARHGVPVVPGRLVTPADAADTLAVVLPAMRAEHGEVFLKTNQGARGEGALILGADGSVRRHQERDAVVEPEAELQRALAAGPVLLQPRLRSHAEVADGTAPHDVVTVRVVTRLSLDGPASFSLALELPRPLDGGRAYYDVLACEPDGVVRGSVRPPWLAAADDPPPAPHALVGRRLETVAAAAGEAVRSHGAVGGVFAVAWDVALTGGGPVVLEGNTHFGSVIPQWVSGGLLGAMGDH